MAKHKLATFKKKVIVILDGYQYCGASKKKIIHDKGFVWCEGNWKCKNNSCSTRLFSRDKEAPENEPDSWEFEAKPNIRVRVKEARKYCVFCVNEIKI